MSLFEVDMAVKKKKAVARPGHKAPEKAPEQKGRGSGGERKEFDNTNRGALFLNDKEGNDARPDYTGIADVVVPEGAKAGDVVKLRIAGWIKQPKSGGDDYLSLNFQKADTQGSNRKKSED